MNGKEFQKMHEIEKRAYCLLKLVEGKSMVAISIQEGLRNADSAKKFRDMLHTLHSMDYDNPCMMRKILGCGYEHVMKAAGILQLITEN